MRASRLVVLVLAALLVTTGCTSVVAGTAMPDAGVSDGPRSGDLSSVLLEVEEINSIMGADDIEVVSSSASMVDHGADVSNPTCVGALYNAEGSVYESTGWTSVAGEVLTQLVDDPDYWVEQTAVQFGSPEEASAFYETSKSHWQECVDQEVSVFDGTYEFSWVFEAMTVTDTTISQSALQLDANGWTCGHALSAVSDVVVEAAACSMELGDEATTIVDALAENAG